MSLSAKGKRQEDASNLSKDLVFQAVATLTLASRPVRGYPALPPLRLPPS